MRHGGKNMAEWESSYSGRRLSNARLLTKEEIDARYPIENDSLMAKLTRRSVEAGYDILYGEKSGFSLLYNIRETSDWIPDIMVTATYLYNELPKKDIIVLPNDIIVGTFTDMSRPDAIYVAVKLKEDY